MTNISLEPRHPRRQAGIQRNKGNRLDIPATHQRGVSGLCFTGAADEGNTARPLDSRASSRMTARGREGEGAEASGGNPEEQRQPPVGHLQQDGSSLPVTFGLARRRVGGPGKSENDTLFYWIPGLRPRMTARGAVGRQRARGRAWWGG